MLTKDVRCRATTTEGCRGRHPCRGAARLKRLVSDERRIAVAIVAVMHLDELTSLAVPEASKDWGNTKGAISNEDWDLPDFFEPDDSWLWRFRKSMPLGGALRRKPTERRMHSARVAAESI